MASPVKGVGGNTTCWSQQRLADRAETTTNDNQLGIKHGYQAAQTLAKSSPNLANEAAGSLISGVRRRCERLRTETALLQDLGELTARVEGMELTTETGQSRPGSNRFPATALAAITLEAVGLVEHVAPFTGE